MTSRGGGKAVKMPAIKCSAHLPRVATTSNARPAIRSVDFSADNKLGNVSNNSRRLFLGDRNILPVIPRRNGEKYKSTTQRFACTEHTTGFPSDRITLKNVTTADFVLPELFRELKTAGPHRLPDVTNAAHGFPRNLATEDQRAREIYSEVKRQVRRSDKAKIREKWREAYRKICIIWKVCRALALASFEVDQTAPKLQKFGDEYRDKTIEAKNYYANFMEHIKKKPEKELQLTHKVRLILLTPPSRRSSDDIYLVMHSLQTVSGFCDYPLDAQRKIAENGYFVQIGERRVIVRQGHKAENWYFVISGQAMVAETDERGMTLVSHNILTRGRSFGEKALIDGTPRTSTVTTRRPMQLVAVSGEDFLHIFNHTFKEVKPPTPDYVHFVRHIEFMRYWPWHQLHQRLAMCSFRYYRRNEVIVADSANSGSIYIIKSGRCSVYEFAESVRANWRDLELCLAHPTINVHQWPTSKQDHGPGKLKRRKSAFTLYNRLSEPQVIAGNLALRKNLALGPPYVGIFDVAQNRPPGPVSPSKSHDDLPTPGLQEGDTVRPPWKYSDEKVCSKRVRSIRRNIAKRKTGPSLGGNSPVTGVTPRGTLVSIDELLETPTSGGGSGSRSTSRQRGSDRGSPVSGERSGASGGGSRVKARRVVTPAANKESKAETENTNQSNRRATRKAHVIESGTLEKKGIPPAHVAEKRKLDAAARSSYNRRRSYSVPTRCKPRVPGTDKENKKHYLYECQSPPSFVLIETLTEGDVFGLDQLKDARFQRVQTHKVSLVSEGAEVILLNKDFFISLMSDRCAAHIIDSIRTYPDQQSLKTRLRLNLAWNLWQRKVVDDMRKDLTNSGRTHSHTYFQEPLALNPNTYLNMGAKYPEDTKAGPQNTRRSRDMI